MSDPAPGPVPQDPNSPPGALEKSDPPGLPAGDPSTMSGADPQTPGPTDSSPPPILPPFREGSVFWRLGGIVRQMRPEQWVKNVFVLGPVVFSKNLTHPTVIVSAIGGFGVFSLLASSIYCINDLIDREADRHHPKKRFRPIASGRVPPTVGKILAALLVVVALAGAMLGPWQFLATVVAYWLMQLAYSFGLKKIAYVDVGIIALGFVLRVLAGSFAVRVQPSFYIIACTALLALFLGFGKRRHELSGANAAKQRAALEQYSPRVLSLAMAVTAVLAVATYLAWTLDASTQALFNSKWLWATTVHPLFGVVRFLQLVASRPKSESPTQEILRDVPFMMNLMLYAAEIIVIVYQLRPG